MTYALTTADSLALATALAQAKEPVDVYRAVEQLVARGPGAKLFGDIEIGPNTAIGANSVVNTSFPEGFMTVAGAPARKVSDTPSTEFIIATRSHKKTLG